MIGEQNNLHETPQTSEAKRVITDERQAQIGASVLSAAGYYNRVPRSLFDVEKELNSRHKDAASQPLKNNNAERAIIGHLDTLRRAINGDDEIQQAVLDEIAQGVHITEMSDLSDNFWASRDLMYRDEYGINAYHVSNEELKNATLEAIQKEQRASIERWRDNLAAESCTYPIWFKLFALDGVSKMGKFDVGKKRFLKRDAETIAPYPSFDARALENVYQSVLAQYEPNGESGPIDEYLKSLVKSGNFNKLYSHFLNQERHVLEVPENAEDVRGEWLEYGPGDEAKLAHAADCTPWCIVDPDVAQNYLEHGNYEGVDLNERTSPSRAKFYVFHLKDAKDDTLSGSGCASIRLDVDGEVAEISGLRKGQSLDLSLVDIVEEKTKTLPGGERYMSAFKDEKRLIEIDRKCNRGEKLTQEDIDFVNSDFETLIAHPEEDSRIDFIRSIVIPHQNGENIYDIIEEVNYGDNDIDSYILLDNLDYLLTYCKDENGDGINDVYDIAEHMSGYVVAYGLRALVEHGAEASKLMKYMNERDILDALDDLVDLGADVNVNELIKDMSHVVIARNLEKLLRHHVDVNYVVSKLSPRQIEKNAQLLKQYGYGNESETAF